MRKISPNELAGLKPKHITEKEWLSLSPTYCVVCKKFIVHWWDAWGNPQPAFSADIKIGGLYCSSHTSEELKENEYTMRCQALDENRLRAWFNISPSGSVGIRLVTPDGHIFLLIKEQVLQAIGEITAEPHKDATINQCVCSHHKWMHTTHGDCRGRDDKIPCECTKFQPIQQEDLL